MQQLLRQLIRVAPNVRGRDADDLKSFRREFGVAFLVSFRPVAHVVRDAVDFDDQADLVAVRVEEVFPRVALLADLQSIRTRLEALPQEHFGKAHFPAQLLRQRLCPSRALQHSDPPLQGEVAAAQRLTEGCRAIERGTPLRHAPAARATSPCRGGSSDGSFHPLTFCAISIALPSGSSKYIALIPSTATSVMSSAGVIPLAASAARVASMSRVSRVTWVIPRIAA
jgi:hypothetical protein